MAEYVRQNGERKMINIAVCDDEEVFIKKIESIVKDYFADKDVDFAIDTYTSSLKFCELKEEMTKYDIVFMDINMDEMDGIETSKLLRTYCSDTYLIFVTAFINYTLEGYKVEAIRYILKDFNNMHVNIAEALEVILKKMDLDSKKMRYEFIGEGERDISINDIVFVENNLHRLTFHMQINGNEEEFKIYKKLSDIETDFDSECLIRTHQSYLVNMKYVKSVSNFRAL